MTEVIRKVFLQIEKLCLSLRAEFLTEISDHFVNKCPLGVTNDDDDDGNKQMNLDLKASKIRQNFIRIFENVENALNVIAKFHFENSFSK